MDCVQCSENKGADQLHSYCAADLRLCFCIRKKQVLSYTSSNSEEAYLQETVVLTFQVGNSNVSWVDSNLNNLFNCQNCYSSIYLTLLSEGVVAPLILQGTLTLQNFLQLTTTLHLPLKDLHFSTTKYCCHHTKIWLIWAREGILLAVTQFGPNRREISPQDASETGPIFMKL